MNMLANKIKNGDEQAFHHFFDQTYPQVMAYLSKVLYSNKYADDVAQEAYIKLWANRTKIDSTQTLDPWLFTIVRNTAISHLRKILAEKQWLNSLGNDALSAESSQQHTIDNEGTHQLYSKDFIALYNQLLKELSPLKQRCFRLHREEGLTYAEIARQEGLAVKTVERYISDALKLLRTKLPAILLLFNIPLLCIYDPTLNNLVTCFLSGQLSLPA